MFRRQTLSLLLAGALAALAFSSLGCASDQIRQPTRVSEEVPTLEIATYNVNFGLAGDDATLGAIPDADVVLLQETSAAWEAQIRAELSERYPHMLFKHCCRAGGLAILSKQPLESIAYIEAPKPGWFPAWIVHAQTPLGKVQLLNVHLRPPVDDRGSWARGYFSTPEIRLAEMQAYHESLEEDLPTIIAGDFNEGEGGEVVKFLREGDFETVLTHYAPGADTWRWQTSLGTVSTQLDHIVYDRQSLEPLDARVLEQGRSDHMPILARFRALEHP